MPEPSIQNIDVATQRIAEEAGVLHETAVQETFNEVTRRIVEATPVKTGRLRASWFASDTPAAGLAGGSEVSPSGGPAVLARTAATIARIVPGVVRAGGVLFFNNGAHYGPRVERRRMFVAQVVAQTASIHQAVIDRIRRIRGR